MLLQLCSYVKLPEIHLLEAYINAQKGNISLAISQYSTMLLNASQQIPHEIILKCKNNLAWLYLMNEKYEKSIQLTNELIQEIGITTANCLNLPYCYWKLGLNGISLNHIQQSTSSITDHLHNNILKALQIINTRQPLQIDKKQFSTIISLFVEEAKNRNDRDFYQFTLLLASELFEAIKAYKQCTICLKRLKRLSKIS